MFGGTADDGRGPVDSALLDRHLRLNPVTPARLGEAFIGIDLFFGYEKKSRGNAKCSHRCLIEIIPHDFSGTIQCDAYGAYRTYAGKHDGIDLAGCWAHARRKFHEALVQGEAKVRAAWILRQIGHLYDIERELRESRAGPRLREAVRRSRSRPILERLHRTFLLLQNRRYYLPKSLLGKALAYALGQWPMLTVFVNDGQIEIDNNLCENAIRPTAVGKKNWLFIGAEEAGWRSAVIYSVIASCRSRGIDPYEYLRDVLTRLPTMTNHQIPTITPAAWAEEQQSDRRLAS